MPQCGDRGRLSRSETAKLVREELPGGPLVTCHTPAGYAWDYECYVPQRRGGTVSMGERIGVNVDAHGITETSRR